MALRFGVRFFLLFSLYSEVGGGGNFISCLPFFPFPFVSPFYVRPFPRGDLGEGVHIPPPSHPPTSTPSCGFLDGPGQ